MPTTKLYYTNPKLASFQAKVINCEAKEDKFVIELDQSAFYPEGGGQPSDTGLLEDIFISHVYEKENIIYHLADKALEIGTKITGTIDYKKRQTYTQLHSGEHIISGLISNHYGYNNVGFHMDENLAVIDIDGELTKKEIQKIEHLANDEIFANNQFIITYPAKEQLESLNYRHKKKLTGDIRIVYAGSADICACCGTHVEHTGEIGLIKILSYQKHRGGMRISLTAGFAALKHYQNCLSSQIEISQNLSTKPEEISQAVIKLQNDLSKEKAIAAKAKHKLMDKLISEFENTSQPIITFEEDLTANELREFALALTSKTSSYVLALSNNPDGYKYALTSQNQPLTTLHQSLKENLDAKGGGKPDLYQGNIQKNLEEIINHTKERKN